MRVIRIPYAVTASAGRGSDAGLDGVERIDLRLQCAEGGGERLLVEEPKQGRVEALVLALRGRLMA